MTTYFRFRVTVEQQGSAVRIHSEDPQGATLRDFTNPLELPASLVHLTEQAARLRRSSRTQNELDALGEALFEALFPDNVYSSLREHYGKLQADQVLRLELDLDEAHLPQVAALPWELLRAPMGTGHPAVNWCTDLKVVLSRRRLLDNPALPITLTEPLRIQLVVSAPQDKDLGTVEYESVLAALQTLARDHPREIAAPPPPLFNPTLTTLEQEVETQKPHVVHFIGHGRLKRLRKQQVAQLAFVGPGKTAVWEDDESVGDVLGKHQIAMVLLQACESGAAGSAEAFVGVASQIVQQNVPVVIAMQFPITNDAAVAFAETFYERLGVLEPVDMAAQKSRRVLRQKYKNSRDYAAPVLYMRVRDGQLFSPGKLPEQKKRDQKENDLPVRGKPKPAKLKNQNHFPDNLFERYPYPLAAPMAAFNRASNDRERFAALDQLTHNLVKYLFAIALSHFRGDLPDKETLHGYRAELTNTELSSRLRVLDSIAAYYADQPALYLHPLLFQPYLSDAPDDSAIADAQRVLRKIEPGARASDSVVTPQTFLQRLVRYRAEHWEGHTEKVDDKIISTFLEPWREAMQEFLMDLEFLLKYPIALVENVNEVNNERVYTLQAFDDAQGSQHVLPEYHEPIGDRPAYPRLRLYLCAPDGKPLLGLHPFLIYSGGKIFFLERGGDTADLLYRHCVTSEPHRLHGSASFFLSSSVQAEAPDPQETDPNAEFEHENEMLDSEEEFLRLVDMSLPKLMERLDSTAMRALHIALGEALRLGDFWLGAEFLLMGLSKLDNGVLPALLDAIDIELGDFRGMLRVLVEVRNSDWRSVRDTERLGAEAFAGLQKPDDMNLAQLYGTPQQPRAILTPRALAVLREAVVNAKDAPATQQDLLLALLQHPQSIAVNLFFAAADKGGIAPNELIAWIQGWGGAEEGEQGSGPQDAPPGSPPRPDQPPARPRQGKGLLGQFGRDLNALAEAGDLHPAIGEGARRAMLQIGMILQQTQANNPILLGDPGVGKTAVVEGFAWRLAVGANHGQPVADALANKRIVDLPQLELLAGTKYRGDLEERLQKILDEVRAARGDTIVFIDEIHTILGGRAEGGLGAIADALKPALARGEFPCIGATTVSEYRRYIESDLALARRFTPVWIDEPSPAEATEIVKDVVQRKLTPKHGVQYPNDVIAEAVRLSVRYVHDRFLPDKAIRLLDQAGPRVMMGGSLRGVEIKNGQSVGGGQVTVETLREIVAERTGIPLTRLSEAESARLLHLEDDLRKRVKGQDEALKQVAQVIKRARTGLGDPRRPAGVFLFAGPTGVGKTELALALAQELFDEEDAIVRLDMSEYMEKHQVSRLIGSPPGYIGYEEEGQLTGRLRRRPYSVVLLDEIEKAHPDVQHMFLQLFDAGRLTDARGNAADGRNAIFVMTTNLGAREAVGFINQPSPYRERLQAAIEQHFSPEFLNRIDRILYFDPLNEETLLAIFDKLLARVQVRLAAQEITLRVTEEFKRDMCERLLKDQSRGARPLERAIEDEIVSPLNDLLLSGKLKSGMEVVWPLASAPSLKPKLQMGFQPPSGPGVSGDVKPSRATENSEQQNREILAPLFEDWKGKWEAQGIQLSLSDSALELLCSPLWLDERESLSTPEAFEKLAQIPLEAELAGGTYKAGDRIEIQRNEQLKFSFVKRKGVGI